jgi:hypothetical protein
MAQAAATCVHGHARAAPSDADHFPTTPPPPAATKENGVIGLGRPRRRPRGVAVAAVSAAIRTEVDAATPVVCGEQGDHGTELTRTATPYKDCRFYVPRPLLLSKAKRASKLRGRKMLIGPTAAPEPSRRHGHGHSRVLLARTRSRLPRLRLAGLEADAVLADRRTLQQAQNQML